MGIGCAGTSGLNVAPALILNQNSFFETASSNRDRRKNSRPGHNKPLALSLCTLGSKMEFPTPGPEKK